MQLMSRSAIPRLTPQVKRWNMQMRLWMATTAFALPNRDHHSFGMRRQFGIEPCLLSQDCLSQMSSRAEPNEKLEKHVMTTPGRVIAIFLSSIISLVFPTSGYPLDRDRTIAQ